MQVTAPAAPGPEVEVYGDEPTALYRFYDPGGALLYVGITANIAQRWEDHSADKFWWPRVARKTVMLYGSRKEALDAESIAILKESPIHNVAGQPPARGDKELIIKRLERRIADAKRVLESDTFTLPPELVSWLDMYRTDTAGDRGTALAHLLYKGMLRHFDEMADAHRVTRTALYAELMNEREERAA